LIQCVRIFGRMTWPSAVSSGLKQSSHTPSKGHTL
jgi:hypothetical protein